MSPKPVLTDHIRRGKKLITPMNAMTGGIREVSWINDMIPEITWIALLQDKYGHTRGVEIITAMTRWLRANFKSEHGEKRLFATATSFESIRQNKEVSTTSLHLTEWWVDPVQSALTPLLALYPKCPIRELIEPSRSGTDDDLKLISRLVDSLFDRNDRDVMMFQATVIWLMFDSEKLKVNADLALAKFPEIERYPETDLSLKVASGIRATLNGVMGQETQSSKWAAYFWNRGLDLSECRYPDGE